jgi:hypothetical protein
MEAQEHDLAEACLFQTEEDKQFLEEAIIQYDVENRITLNQIIEGITQSVLEEEGNRDAYAVESAKTTLTEQEFTKPTLSRNRKSPYKRGGMKGGGKLKYLRVVSKLLALIIYLGVSYGIYTGISWAVGLIVARISASSLISENTIDEMYQSCVQIFKPPNHGRYYLTEQEAVESALGGIVKPVKSVVRRIPGVLWGFSDVQEENPLYEGQMNAYDHAYQGLLKEHNAWTIYKNSLAKKEFTERCMSANMMEHLKALTSQIVTLVSLVGTSGIALSSIIRQPYVFMEEKIYLLLSDTVNDYNVIDSIISGDVTPDMVKKIYERRPKLISSARERAIKLLKSRGLYTEFVREGEGKPYTVQTPDYRNFPPPYAKLYNKANKRAEELFGIPEQLRAQEAEEASKRQAEEATHKRRIEFYKSQGMEPPLEQVSEMTIQQQPVEMNRMLNDPYGAVGIRPSKDEFVDESDAYSQYYRTLEEQRLANPQEEYMVEEPPTYAESMEQAAFEEMSGGRHKKRTKRNKKGGKKKTIRRRKAKTMKGKRKL